MTFSSNPSGEKTRYQINVIEMNCIELFFLRNPFILIQILLYNCGLLMILGKGCRHKPKAIPYILRGEKCLFFLVLLLVYVQECFLCIYVCVLCVCISHGS